MSEHTPGPWKVIGLDDNTYINPLRDTGEYALICKVMRNHKDKKTNAQLIASAPDLYDALNHLKYWLFDGEKLHKIDDKILKEVIKEVNGAIAKAEGK